MSAPDAPRPAANVTDVLAAHAPRTQPPMGLVVGCSCGWRIGRTMYEGYDTHVAAALAEAGIGPVAEAERRGVNEGVRLAAHLVRDHVLGETGERVADFLIARAARAAAEQVAPNA